MPRISQAASTVTRLSPLDRLAPPAELGEVEAQEFRRTIATAPPNHFRAEDLPLLCSYSRAIVMERRASEALAAAIDAGNVPTPWLGVYASLAKTMMVLTVRLRLGPLSRSNNNRRRPGSVGIGGLSFYERMDLEGDAYAPEGSRGADTGAADCES